MIEETKTPLEKIQEFHDAMGITSAFPRFGVTPDTMVLRARLVLEEAVEANNALIDLAAASAAGVGFEDIAGSDEAHFQKILDERRGQVLKELSDVLVVILGTFDVLGLDRDDLDDAFGLVHDSNMTKLGDDGKPVRNEFGKIVKGPNYKAPDMEALARQWRNEV